MCIKSITTYTLNYKINVLSIPPLKEWAFRTLICKRSKTEKFRLYYHVLISSNQQR